MKIEPNVEVCRIVKSSDANNYGTLHGGVVLHLVEEAGMVAFARHLRTHPTMTGCPLLCRIEKTSFVSPAFVGDLVVATADVAFTSAHSSCVKVSVHSLNNNSAEKLVSEAVLWYVNCEVQKEAKQIKPVPVPPLDVKPDYYDTAQALYLRNKEARLQSCQSHDASRDYFFSRLRAEHPPFSCFANAFESRVLVTNNDCSHLGPAYGGFLLKNMDVFCAIAAAKHCNSRVVTVGVDSFNIYRPVFWDDVCCFCPWVVFCSRRSVEVKINVYVEAARTGGAELVCSAYFTFVSLDGEGKTQCIPQLVTETEADRALNAQRLRLYQERKSHRK